jgi:hypothetical protein
VSISERAQENRAYVRRLLREKQPEFAAALESAVRQLSCPICEAVAVASAMTATGCLAC